MSHLSVGQTQYGFLSNSPDEVEIPFKRTEGGEGDDCPSGMRGPQETPENFLKVCAQRGTKDTTRDVQYTLGHVQRTSC